MLELYDADGAFEALEAYLAEELHEGLVADVYLGYGLGEPLRREPWPAPPEPCPLPLLAAQIRLCDESPQSGSDFRLGEWEATWAPEDYAAAVDEVRAAIARGDVYQVNLVQHLSAAFEGDPFALAAALAPLHPLHPRPLVGDGWAIVSASPELFLARRGDRLVTMPIKGTRPIGEDVDDAKDAAEHVMIVDLERNDLSRVSEIGSIRWPELMAQHELAGVTHLVSTVEGRVRSDATLAGIDHRRTQDLRSRPHRPSRAGRARRVDGRARDDPGERRLRARADDPHLRRRGGSRAPLGRRRDRLGLGSGS